ncbi:MAG: glycosyltransferase [Eubacteriales bacterium]
MREVNLVFVILHYLTTEETVQSIASIKRYMDTASYGIIVVDNASPNDSIQLLHSKYETEGDTIHIVESSENVGYARGLNIGIRRAKELYDFQYMILMNNDIYFLEHQLYEKLECQYGKSQFAVLGPMILCGDGTCNTNPYEMNLIDREEIRARLAIYKKQEWLLKRNLYNLYNLLNGIKDDIITFCQRTKKLKQGKAYWLEQENVLLHGSIWIFSQDYFKKFSQLDERTFIYSEEDVLFVHLFAHGMKSVYQPDIKVFHVGSSSMNQLHTKEIKKRLLWKINNLQQGLHHLLEVMDEYESV